MEYQTQVFFASNGQNKWYSKEWSKPKVSINGGEWQDYEGEIIAGNDVVRARMAKYKPTIKQRITCLLNSF